MTTHLIAIEGNQMLPAKITFDDVGKMSVKLLWDSSEERHDEFIKRGINSFIDRTYSILN